MSTSIVKRKKMKALVYSTLLKLEKTGENVIDYLFDLLKEFENKKINIKAIKSKKLKTRRKSVQHLHDKTLNNIGRNNKKNKKIKKKVNTNDIYRGSKKVKRRSNSLQNLKYHLPSNNKKHKKNKKKIKKKKKVRYHTDDDEDEYIDHGMEAMINNLEIPQNARPKVMEMNSSKKILLMKQWFVSPRSRRHVRASSDPSSPQLCQQAKSAPFPDSFDNDRNNKIKEHRRKKLRNMKSNEAKKRMKSKSMAPIKKNKNKKVKKRVFYANELSRNQQKQNKHKKTVKFDDVNNNYTKRKPKLNKSRSFKTKSTNKAHLDLMPYSSTYAEEYSF